MERWTAEECANRFIQGSQITLEELSRLSLVPLSTLKKWSQRGHWVQTREDYQTRLATEIREKTIEKTSDRLSDELSTLAVEHLGAYQVCRRIAMLKGQYVLSKLEKAFQEPGSHAELPDELTSELSNEIQTRALAEVDIGELNVISLIIDRSVRGERLSAGLEYDDINKAIARVEQTGLRVVAPDDSIIAKLVNGA